MNHKDVLATMGNIIERYLDNRYNSVEAVNNLIQSINLEELLDSQPDFIITDCYFSIKHLTETGYETTKAELAYFRDCINGTRKYDLNEKLNFTPRKE